MKIFEVILRRKAVKQFKALDPDIRSRIKKGLRELAKDSFTNRGGCDIKQLQGRKHDFYRLRVGVHRIIYTLFKKEIVVTEIRPRKKGYSFLE